eukprot:CAMPEP_0115328154 /NCGR_PEP_ID=MMETSP0270-20121206/84523_1 /TAXON_ID=71861 /ORGANISM="Scrippsiella trochoidea, Strain CCMP3099" /LENGTH=151 /DNA_ID=CAMNT_0002748645 /DNA_START=23 /DNA_END=475 /DNA_ORIENTATION=+
MAPFLDFTETLDERRTKTEDTAAIFESSPLETQADESYFGSRSTNAKSTADWLLEVEQLAQKQELPTQGGLEVEEEADCFVGDYPALHDDSGGGGACGEKTGGAAGGQASAEKEAAMLFSLAEVHLDDAAAAEALRTALASEQLFAQLGDW